MQALSLDAAGTLFDLAEPVGEVYARIAQKHGYSLAPATVFTGFGKVFTTLPAPDYAGFETGHACETAWWRELVLRVTQFPDDDRFESFFSELFDFYAQPDAWNLFPDTLPFLEKAARDYRLIVLSNFDARLHPILKGLQLFDYFEAAISSADALARKPDAKIFQVALASLKLPAAEVRHIGDSLVADYEGALALGMSGFHLRREKGHTLIDAL